MKTQPAASQKSDEKIDEVEKHEITAMSESDLALMKDIFGKDPYKKKLSEIERGTADLLKKISDLTGIDESDTGLLPPKLWDLKADMDAALNDQTLIIGNLTKIFEPKKMGQPARYLVSLNHRGKYVVDLAKDLSPEDVEEGMRVAVARSDFKITLPMPPHLLTKVALMQVEDKPDVTYADIGGCKEEIEKIREIVEFPLLQPEKFTKLGIDPPKGALMFGPPGTGKTLCARAVANRTDAFFIRVNGSELVQRYVGEGAKIVRDIFTLAKQKKLSIIFFDEIDAIGGARFSEAENAEHEVQRTMLELVNQLDGFESRGNVKVLMATNRPDTLDPALVRPGRLDRKVEFKLPDLKGREAIFKIHTKQMNIQRGIRFGMIARLCPNSTGADIRSVCTEAGVFAIRKRRKVATEADFMQAVDKVIKGYAKFGATSRYATHN